MPHRRSTSCCARSTPSVYTTCLACVRLADHTRSRARRRPGASPHRVHPESPTEDTIYRERPRQRGNRNIGRDRHGESATRAHTHPSPGSRRARAPGSRRRKWRAGCAGPGRARGSRLGVRLRVGSPDSARGGTARTVLPHIHERIVNRESRRRLADLEIPGGFGNQRKQ